MDLKAIQAALHERNFDAWLFYDHHHRDPIAYKVLGIPESLMVSRRWFYVIPREGELVRSFGKEIVSSGDLVARFEAAWTEEQIASHFAARDSIDAIIPEAFKEIGRRVRSGNVTEYEIQQWFARAFEREKIITEDLPIVAVNANSGNPHYEPKAEGSAQIKPGDFVLLDVWGKKNTPGSVYYDITWTGVIGTPTDHQVEIFNIVAGGRD